MFVTVLFSCLLLVQVPYSGAKAFPRGLADFLEKVGIPVDKFLDRFLDSTYQDSDVITTAQFDERTQLQDSSDTPEHSKGVNTTKTNETKILAEAFCTPRPTAVRIPRHPGIFGTPDHVILQRCTGSCPYVPDASHCTVTHQDEISVQTYGNSGGSWGYKYITMYNHTACECDCIKKESDCHPKKQSWNKHTCSCECNSSESQCNPQKQQWVEAKCECECKLAPSHCGQTKEWDYKKCGCHCNKYSKEYCMDQNLPIDTTTCLCIQSGINALN